MKTLRFETNTIMTIVRRRVGRFAYKITIKKFINIIISIVQYLSKSSQVNSYPVMIKIDISPSCNLRCVTCVHARANGDPDLEKQHFSYKDQCMQIEQFKETIQQIKEYSSSVSLNYLGDPLMHPQLEEMCRIASDAKLSVHIGTNFSYKLTDDKIYRLLKCGITHFTACVDGLSQEKYKLTRVGGSIELVLDNIRRLCQFKKKFGQQHPLIEVQYIKFQHNAEEVDLAEEMLYKMGVDKFVVQWGILHNYADVGPNRYNVLGPKKPKKLPLCLWPYFNIVIKYNGDVIPCCWYREGEQYAVNGDARIIDNIFKTPLQQIWRSKEYKTIRSLASNPIKVANKSESKSSFCDGCSVIFNTDSWKSVRLASNIKWSDLYFIDDQNLPARKETL